MPRKASTTKQRNFNNQAENRHKLQRMVYDMSADEVAALLRMAERIQEAYGKVREKSYHSVEAAG